jgi:hypothetical protein
MTKHATFLHLEMTAGPFGNFGARKRFAAIKIGGHLVGGVAASLPD